MPGTVLATSNRSMHEAVEVRGSVRSWAKLQKSPSSALRRAEALSGRNGLYAYAHREGGDEESVCRPRPLRESRPEWWPEQGLMDS